MAALLPLVQALRARISPGCREEEVARRVLRVLVPGFRRAAVTQLVMYGFFPASGLNSVPQTGHSTTSMRGRTISAGWILAWQFGQVVLRSILVGSLSGAGICEEGTR